MKKDANVGLLICSSFILSIKRSQPLASYPLMNYSEDSYRPGRKWHHSFTGQMFITSSLSSTNYLLKGLNGKLTKIIIKNKPYREQPGVYQGIFAININQYSSGDTVITTAPMDLMINTIISECELLRADISSYTFLKNLEQMVIKSNCKVLYFRPVCTYPA